tara:strand:+ start:2785 stop:4875 length:2091 start_codon:yes stop_codon:yes gene_type:complete
VPANSTEDKILHSDEPEISELNAELYRASSDRRINNRVKEADETRFSYWTGQTSDGRKHTSNQQKQVHPWEGASDSRILLADEYCDFYVSLLDGADTRCALNVNPVEAADAPNAAGIQIYMGWLLNTWLAPSWEDELELVKQYTAQYGWSGVHTTWNRSYQNIPKTLTLESLGKFMGIEGDSVTESLPAILAQQSDFLVDVMLAQSPGLKKSEIKTRIKELGENGKTTIETPAIVADHPEIVALKPYSEILFPPETRGIQRARMVFRRDSYTVAELEDLANASDWDSEWVDEVKKTAGQDNRWWDRGVSAVARTAAQVSDGQNMVEVVHAYSRRLDKDGVPGVYQTIFSPFHDRDSSGSESYAKHELVTEAAGKYPIDVFTRERTSREVIESRGIPEIAATWQSEYKAQIDMLFDRSNLETLPPLKVPLRYGNRISIGPGKQISEQRPGDISFMDPPKKGPDVALKNIEAIELRGDRYFGRPNPALEQMTSQLKQQAQVNRWLRFKGSLIRNVWEQVQRFGSDKEFGEVTGTGEPIPKDSQKYNFALSYDIRELDSEFTQKQLKAVSEIIVPQDVAGSIDRRKLVEVQLRAINPTFPDMLMVNQDQANQAMFNEVRQELAQMSLGNQPNLVESDPTAEAKMQFAQQIIESNPKYQEQAGSDEQFQELLQKYFQNLQMSVMQKQNAQIGRLGVQPNA